VPVLAGKKEEKKLLAVHNLSEEKLRFADKIGGLANPSMAVINPKVTPFENYGDISLIGNKDLIEGEKTRLSDAYTARFPSVHSTMSYSDFDKMQKEFEPYYVKSGDTKKMYRDDSDMVRIIENNSAVALKFLEDNNITPSKDGYGYYHSQIKNAGLDGKFQEFLNEIYKKYNLQEKLFAGYTNSGQRRYRPVTVEEASKIMSKQKDEGYNYGLGSIRSKIAPVKTSTKEISKESDRLISKEDFESEKKLYDDELYALRDKLSQYAINTDSNSFIEFDRQLNAIGELLMGQKDAMYYFRNKYPKAPQSLVDDVLKFRNKLKNMPTEYFETKFKRPVRIEEFRTAVVPDSITPEAENTLKKRGLEVIKYKQGERGKTLQGLLKTDVAFKKPVFTKLEGMKMDIAEIKKIVREELADPKMRVIFSDELIEGVALGQYEKTTWGNVIRLYEENGKSSLLTALHEVKHSIFQGLEASIRAEAFRLAKEEIGPVEMKALKITYSELSEEGILEEYIVNKWARATASEKYGYKKTVWEKVFDALDQFLKRVVNTFDQVKSKIDNFVKEAGGAQKGAIRLFDDMKSEKPEPEKLSFEDTSGIEITGEKLRELWGDEKTVEIAGNNFRVGKMSYGDYFLEPVSWKGGETDGFSRQTIWLKKSDTKKNIYKADTTISKIEKDVSEIKSEIKKLSEKVTEPKKEDKPKEEKVEPQKIETEKVMERVDDQDLLDIAKEELDLNETDLDQAIDDYNDYLANRHAVSPKVAPMEAFANKLSEAEFLALKPAQRLNVLGFLAEEKRPQFERILEVAEVKESTEPGPVDTMVADMLGGRIKMNLNERKTEFKEMFGEALYRKINKADGFGIDHYVEQVNSQLSERIEIDDLLDALWREVNQREKLKPVQVSIRKKYREAMGAWRSRRYTLENVMKRVAKERNKQVKASARILEAKEKVQAKLAEFIRLGRDRRQKLEAIQDFFALSDSQMAKVQGRKDIRTMTEVEFNDFLTRVQTKANQEAEKLAIKSQLLGQIQQKELLGVDNLRNALQLPPINQMTTAQLRQMDEALSPYVFGDEFLSQRKLETIDKTDFKGVKTMREAREKVAQKLGIKPSDVGVTFSEFDRFKGDATLAQENPFYKYLIENYHKTAMEAETRFEDIRKETDEKLGKTRKGFQIIPQDKKIIQYLEAENKETALAEMTPEEIEAATFIENELAKAYKYELENKVLTGSRFEGMYVPHIQRTFFEAFKDSGLKQAFKEMIDQHKIDEKVLNILDQKTGEILPYEKFFKFAMMRTGQINPTQNVAKAFLTYMKAFETKRALDSIIPEIMTAVDIISPREMTERGLAVDDRLKTFTTEWINTKKGRPVKKFVQPGGKADFVLRALKAFVNFKYLGLNIPLQIGSFGGTETATYVSLGVKKYATGKFRRFTKQGKEIGRKYENYVGKTVWDGLHEASKELPQKVNETLFGLFRLAERESNITHLLGNMTTEEFEKGELSPEKLAQLKLDQSRWLPLSETKSIYGSTTEGGLVTQFKRWAIVPLGTARLNLVKIAGMVKSGEYKQASKSKEFRELMRITHVALVVGLLALTVDYDPDEKPDTFFGKMLHNLIRDALSLVSIFDPATWMKVSIPIASVFEDLAKSLADIIRLTEYKTSGADYKKGDLKGLNELKNLVLPTFAKQAIDLVSPKPKKTKGGTGLPTLPKLPKLPKMPSLPKI